MPDLDTLLNRASPQFDRAMLALAAARARGDDADAEIARLARVIGDTRALADLLGREKLARETGFRGIAQFAEAVSPVVQQPTYAQAVAAILRRTPVLARNWEAVAEAHRAGAQAFAQAAGLAVTRQVQEALAGTLAVGQTRDYFRALLDSIAPWTRAYADTVYRTNLASAYTEGQFEMARDPDVQDLFAGWEFSATMDSNTRPNHAAANRLTAAVDDAIWGSLRPPLGYNCRCDLLVVTMQDARRRGLLRQGRLPLARRPPGAYPDEGFNNG